MLKSSFEKLKGDPNQHWSGFQGIDLNIQYIHLNFITVCILLFTISYYLNVYLMQDKLIRRQMWLLKHGMKRWTSIARRISSK